jgi:GT2 family glycosyltransferase
MNLASVIVHFEHPELTHKILQRLSSYDIISSVVAVIHDDAHFEDFGAKVVYLYQDNRGYAAGINRGVRFLLENSPDIDLVLGLNPDVKIEESEILDLLDEHIASNADCTFPALAEATGVIHGYRIGRLGSVRPAKTEADFYSGACFLFSVNAWKQVDGLDESYFHYFEDADFCSRLRAAGLRIHHASGILVQHTGKSGVDYPATILPRYAVRNHLRFVRKIERLNALSFCNITLRHLLYLLRWKRGSRGVREWLVGIREFRKTT